MLLGLALKVTFVLIRVRNLLCIPCCCSIQRRSLECVFFCYFVINLFRLVLRIRLSLLYSTRT